jgi:hypothetical protein
MWYAPSFFITRNSSRQRAQAMKNWINTGDTSVLPLGLIPPEQARTNLVNAVKSGNYRP